MVVKIGDKIKIINIKGAPQCTNKEGFVTAFFDDCIIGTWDSIPIKNGDSYQIIKEKVNV